MDLKSKLIISLVLFFLLLIVSLNIINLYKCNYTKGYTKPMHPNFTTKNIIKYKFDEKCKCEKEFLLKVYIPLEYKGIVINKYKHECDHSIKHIDIDIGDYFIQIRPFFLFGPDNCNIFWDNVFIGDSVFKVSNSLQLKVINHNDNKDTILNIVSPITPNDENIYEIIKEELRK